MASVRRGDTTVVGIEPVEVVAACGVGAVDRLDALSPGFWVGWCSFELGHTLERVQLRSASLESPVVPDVLFARFDAVAVVGADGDVRIEGAGPGRRLLEAARRDARPTDIGEIGIGEIGIGEIGIGGPSTGVWRSSLDHDAYRDRVDTILELLRAGECYQVNLTRRLTCDRPSTRSRSSARWPTGIRRHTPRCCASPISVPVSRSSPPHPSASCACADARSRPARSRAPRRRRAVLAREREGPGRERDDRRPRPQRPRPRVRAPGRSRCPRCARSRPTPGSSTW